jgi:16S rRNA (guanine527-N7)-methyltransferase
MGLNTGNPHGFSPPEIEAGVSPMLLQPLSADAYPTLSRYLKLLTHWNNKMNLTAVRDPEVLVRLHLAECLRAAQRIPAGVETVLDFGSGAGFPGIPTQIVRPELRVTLAESQKKKAAFLREAVRDLGLSGASVHTGRVEDMHGSSIFDLVTLRAVDKMGEAMGATLPRMRSRGICMVLTSHSQVPEVIAASNLLEGAAPPRVDWLPAEPIPGTTQRVLLIGQRTR